MLTKKPISSSTSPWLRLAIGVPTEMSVWPVWRWRSAWKPARSVMNRVAPLVAAEGAQRLGQGGPEERMEQAARRLGEDRPRPVGGQLEHRGAPASCSRHQASWRSSTSPCSHRRCQAAKSAYWMASGGSGGRRAREPRAVEGRQLAHEDADRPAVEDDVVEREEHGVVVLAEAHQEAAHERAVRAR